MCGIVGYVGHRTAAEVVLDGLRRLEYRGYDSAGIALVFDEARPEVEAFGNVFAVEKRAGKLANLEAALGASTRPDAFCGIGHTRWATHGIPSDDNAHPHVSADGRIALIHNGIIENFGQLREAALELAKEGIQVSRFKGLGEMNPEQLWETTMNAETRSLLRVRIEDAVAADEIFTTLMGDQVEPRREFIERNALAVAHLDT
jgi:DNA gyrase/topoisomerase IV subunit B